MHASRAPSALALAAALAACAGASAKPAEPAAAADSSAPMELAAPATSPEEVAVYEVTRGPRCPVVRMQTVQAFSKEGLREAAYRLRGNAVVRVRWSSTPPDRRPQAARLGMREPIRLLFTGTVVRYRSAWCTS